MKLFEPKLVSKDMIKERAFVVEIFNINSLEISSACK